MTHARDALVEEVAKELCRVDEGSWEHTCEREPFPRFWEGSLTTRDDYREAAAAVIDLIRSRLSDVTPEMVEAWKGVSGAEFESLYGWCGAEWRAMLAASVLGPGEGK
jgi:hypothetical protein